MSINISIHHGQLSKPVNNSTINQQPTALPPTTTITLGATPPRPSRHFISKAYAAYLLINVLILLLSVLSDNIIRILYLYFLIIFLIFIIISFFFNFNILFFVLYMYISLLKCQIHIYNDPRVQSVAIPELILHLVGLRWVIYW